MTAPRPTGIGEGRGDGESGEPNVSTDLAAELNAGHVAAYGAAWASLEAAKRVGDLLIGNACSDAWIEENCVFSARTGRLYKQVSKGWAIIERSRTGNALPDISLRGAIKLLAKPKPAAERSAIALPRGSQIEPRVGVSRGDVRVLVWPAEDPLPILAEHPAPWVGIYADGVRFLTPSTEYPGHGYIDDVNTTEGHVDVARRPMNFGALQRFYPRTIWLRQDEVEGAAEFVARNLPERLDEKAHLANVTREALERIANAEATAVARDIATAATGT